MKEKPFINMLNLLKAKHQLNVADVMAINKVSVLFKQHLRELRSNITVIDDDNIFPVVKDGQQFIEDENSIVEP
jgi:hypothetical protein